jgi:hypothetical protein
MPRKPAPPQCTTSAPRQPSLTTTHIRWPPHLRHGRGTSPGTTPTATAQMQAKHLTLPHPHHHHNHHGLIAHAPKTLLAAARHHTTASHGRVPTHTKTAYHVHTTPHPSSTTNNYGTTCNHTGTTLMISHGFRGIGQRLTGATSAEPHSTHAQGCGNTKTRRRSVNEHRVFSPTAHIHPVPPTTPIQR